MDRESLVTEHIEAGARFLAEFDKYAPVQTAFWLKEPERLQWYLHVASERITPDTFDAANAEVLRLLLQMRDPYLDFSSVTILEGEEPLARAMLALRQRYPGPTPIRLRDEFLGGRSIEGAYLYPVLEVVPDAAARPG